MSRWVVLLFSVFAVSTSIWADKPPKKVPGNGAHRGSHQDVDQKLEKILKTMQEGFHQQSQITKKVSTKLEGIEKRVTALEKERETTITNTVNVIRPNSCDSCVAKVMIPCKVEKTILQKVCEEKRIPCTREVKVIEYEEEKCRKEVSRCWNRRTRCYDVTYEWVAVRKPVVKYKTEHYIETVFVEKVVPCVIEKETTIEATIAIHR